jgi:hypothetical protein
MFPVRAVWCHQSLDASGATSARGCDAAAVPGPCRHQGLVAVVLPSAATTIAGPKTGRQLSESPETWTPQACRSRRGDVS